MVFDNKTNLKAFIKKASNRLPLLIALCFLVLITKANQPQQLSHLFAKSQAKVTQVNYEYFSTQFSKESFTYSINLGNYGTYELQLKPNELFAPDFKEQLQKKNSLPLTFLGKIANQLQSEVALTVNQNFMSGYLFNGETTIYFEPLRNFSKQAKANELIIYDEKDALNEKFHCAHDPHDHEPLSFKVAEQQQQVAKRAACNEYTIEMVLVTDFSMFQKYGSVASVRNQITGIVNAAKANFDDEFNDPIKFTVVDEYIATSANDDLWDTDEKNGSKLLKQFAESNFTDKIFDLASLWVTREIFDIQDGAEIDIAGIAYDRGVCKETDKYNLLRDYNAPFESLRTTFAHELGHNFSAFHDADNTEFIMTEATPSDTWSSASLNSINSFYPNTNCLCSTEFVDFEAQSFCVSFGVGNTITKAPTFENIGNVASEPTMLGVFLSEDAEITVDDYLLKKVSFDALQPGESRNVNVSINFSTADLPCGDYFYGIIADAENSTIEPDETNNVACTGRHSIVDCPEQKPDLTIENCANLTISGNTINTGSFTVKNIGDATASPTMLGIYFSSNTVVDNNDYLIIQSTYATLAAGSSINRTLARNISEVNPPIPAGTYYVIFQADRNKTLTEANENNNSCFNSSPRFTVTYGCKDANAHNYNPNATYEDESLCETCNDRTKNGDEEGEDCGGSCPNNCEPQIPDLTIENCGLLSISENTINTGSFSVKNIGDATASPTMLGIYLSSNTVVDNNDHLIIQSTYATLAAGSSINRTLARNISEVSPPIPAGTYYVVFQADRNKTLSEANENNNSCFNSSPRFTVTYGCKDVAANNYDPDATYEDESLCETCNDAISSQIGNGFIGKNNQDLLGLRADVNADGSRVAIGSQNYDYESGIDNGLVRIFDRINNNWVQVGNDISGSSNQQLGTRVSISSNGKRIAVGYKFNLNFTKVFELKGNVWSQLGNTIYSNSGEVKLSGDGNTLITSEWADDTFGNNFGIVNVFEFNGTSWNEKGTVNRTTVNSVGFGQAIDISSNGSRIAVKSYNSASKVGIVNIYAWNQSNRIWRPYGNTLLGNDQNSQFGQSIAMNKDGKTIAIDARQGNSAVYKFDGINGNVWRQVGGLIDESFLLDGWSQIDISADGKVVALSNPRQKVNGNYQYGAFAKYKLENDKWVKIGNTIFGNSTNKLFGINAVLSENGKVTIIGGYNSDYKGYAKVYESDCEPGTKIAHHAEIETYNFPNPFDNQTTISYSLPEESTVTLTIYDGMGKQVTILHKHETKQAGTHLINFRGSNYPPGIYYYSLQAGDYIETQKMILMK